MKIKISDFGKDHWSILAYIETLCVDSVQGIGIIDKAKMRTDIKRHLLLCGDSYGNKDGYKYPTRLKGGKELFDHDDWDCLEDLEEAGFVVVASLINGFVKMTDLGWKVASALRKHKANGGKFADFVWEEKDEEKNRI